MTSGQRHRRPRRERVVEDLLDAAAVVFAECGYEAASVETICEAAGYSTGALYSNFKSKDDLFLRLYEARIARRARELREVVGDAGGGAAGLIAAAARFSETVENEKEWFLLFLEFTLHAARDPAFGVGFKKRREEALRELETGIAEGLAEAGLAASLSERDLARAVRALTHGFAIERILEETDRSEALPGEVMRLVFRAATAEGSR